MKRPTSRAERRRAERAGPPPSHKARYIVAAISVVVLAAAVWVVYSSRQPEAPVATPLDDMPRGNPLKMLADEITAGCPRMMDENTQLDSAQGGPGLRFAYYFTLPGESAAAQTEAEFVQRMRPMVGVKLRLSDEVEVLREVAVTLEYHYADPAGDLLGVVLFRPGEY